MNEITDKSPLDLDTDLAWEQWGKSDPYFGVFTHPKFRRAALTEEAKREFFGTGEAEVATALATIRKHIDPEFAPQRILDFGCGVGRLVLAFAKIADQVVGLDVSASMLEEATRNCQERGLQNVRLLQSDDYLSTMNDTFDLIYSFIVFQHIPIERGRPILTRLLRRLRPGGVGAIHLTYSKTGFADTNGVAPTEFRTQSNSASAVPAGADPEMQMNSYNMNEVLFLLQSKGAERLHLEFTDHGGELGVFVYFALPATHAPTPA